LNTIKLLTALGICCVIFALITSCNSDYNPKRRGYFKIDLPQHQYRTFDQPGFPYTFEYPVYANVVQDSTFFDKAPENPYWINIEFPRFDAKIYISYKDIGRQTDQGSVGHNRASRRLRPRGSEARSSNEGLPTKASKKSRVWSDQDPSNPQGCCPKGNKLKSNKIRSWSDQDRLLIKKGQNGNSAPFKIQYPMKNHAINGVGKELIVTDLK